MDPLNLHKTNTTKFILAMIFDEETKATNILENNFIDSYTYDFYEPDNDGCIIVVKTDDEKLKGTTSEPIRQYSRGKDYIFVYEVPEKFKREYDYIVKGDILKTDPSYKLKLINFWEEPFESRTTFTNIMISANKINSKLYSYNPFEEVYLRRRREVT